MSCTLNPQTYRGNDVEFPTAARVLALWRRAEQEEFGISTLRGAANNRAMIEFEVEDVDQQYARLKGMPIEWIREPTTQPWGHRALYLRDPDGNLVNLFTPVSPAR